MRESALDVPTKTFETMTKYTGKTVVVVRFDGVNKWSEYVPSTFPFARPLRSVVDLGHFPRP